MKVTVKTIDSANASLSGKIDAAALKAKTEELAKQAAKTAKIEGFRKGHVPASLMLQRYGKELEQDAKNRLLGDMLNEGLKELKKDANTMIGEPLVNKFDEKDGAIETEIIVSFRPSVDVSGYEALKPKFDMPKAEQKEVDEQLNNILKRFGTLEKSSKKALENGLFAKFDFEGFVDGKAFDGGKAENFVLEIGSGQFIPGFEEGMIGLKAGEEKEVKVTFPAEYGAAHLAGKDAVFKVKLHEIQEQKLAELNDETLKKIMPNEEKPTKEMLEDSIKEQIKTNKFITLLNGEIKEKFADALVNKFDFDLPQNILDQEINMRFRNEWYKFSQDEQKKFQEDKNALQKQLDTYKDDASRSVKLTFIIDELAKVNNITVSDQELLQTIYMEAYRTGVNPKEHLEYYKNSGMLPAVKMAIVEEKLFLELFPIDKDEKDAKKPAKKSEPKVEKAEKADEPKAEKKPVAKKTVAKKDDEKAEKPVRKPRAKKEDKGE